MSYYYINSLLNKEWNGGLFIRYHLGLYLIKNTPLAPNTVGGYGLSQMESHGAVGRSVGQS